MPDPVRILTDEYKSVRETRDDLIRLATHIHQVDNSIWLSPGEGATNGTATFSAAWPVSSLADGSTTGTRISKYLPENWVNQVAHIVWYVSENGADAGNFRINTFLKNFSDINGVDVNAASELMNESVTTAAGAVFTPLAVTTSSFTLTGRFFTVSFTRVGADAADTATAALILWGGLLVRE